MPVPFLAFAQQAAGRRLGMDDLLEHPAFQRLERRLGGKEHEAAAPGDDDASGAAMNFDGVSVRCRHGAPFGVTASAAPARWDCLVSVAVQVVA